MAALTMAGVMLVGLVVAPEPLHRMLRSIPKIVGKGTTVVVLSILYGLVFWPLGLIVRRGVNARFRRDWSANAQTYWKARTRESSPERPF